MERYALKEPFAEFLFGHTNKLRGAENRSKVRQYRAYSFPCSPGGHSFGARNCELKVWALSSAATCRCRLFDLLEWPARSGLRPTVLGCAKISFHFRFRLRFRDASCPDSDPHAARSEDVAPLGRVLAGGISCAEACARSRRANAVSERTRLRPPPVVKCHIEGSGFWLKTIKHISLARSSVASRA